MAGAPNILLVDSDPDDVRTVREVVESAGLDLHVTSDRSAAIEVIDAIQPGLVLLQERGQDSEDFTKQLRAAAGVAAMPVVVIRDGGMAGWSTADSGTPPRQILKPLGAPALLSLLAHYFPSAFLPPVSPSDAFPSSGQPASASTGQHVLGSPHASSDSFASALDEGSLIDLLDNVFPEEDSGDLAAGLAGQGPLPASPDRPAPSGSKPARDVLGPPTPHEGPSAKVAERTWPPTQSATGRDPERTWPPTQTPPRKDAETTWPPMQPAKKRDSEGTWPPTQAATRKDAEKTPPPTQAPQKRDAERTWPPSQAQAPHQEKKAQSLWPPAQAGAQTTPEAVKPPDRTSTPKRSVPVSPPPPGQSRPARGDFMPAQAGNPVADPPTLAVQPAADAVTTFEVRARTGHRDPHHSGQARPAPRASASRKGRWVVLIGLGIAAAVGTLAITRWISGGETDLRPNVQSSRGGRAPDGAPSESHQPQASPGGSLTDPERPLLPDPSSSVSPIHPSPSSSATASTAPAAAAGIGASKTTALPSPVRPSRGRAADVRPPAPRESGAHVSGAGRQAQESRSTGDPAPKPVHEPPPGEIEHAKSSVVPAPGAAREDERVEPQPSATGTEEKPAAAVHAGPEHPAEPSAAEPAPAPAATSAPASTREDENSSPAPPRASEPSPSSPSSSAPADPSAASATDLPLLAPAPISRPQPRYPHSARSKIAGSVRLLVRVSEDGSVSIARVVGPLDPTLDQAAVRAVLDWKYRPAQLGDRTVSAWVEESVSFKP